MTTTSALLLTVAVASLFSGCAAFSPSSSTSLSFGGGPSSHPPPVARRVSAPAQFPPGRRRSTNDARIRPNPRNNVDAPPSSFSSRVGTALSMGIRSFIKRKFLGRGEGGGEDGDGDGGGEDDVTLHSIMQSPGSFGLLESPNSVEDEADREVYGRKASSSYDAEETTKPGRPAIYEDTQERIRRMKGGGMTEEEKARFLNNALTGALPKQKPRGPPIRQKIPGGTEGGGDAGGGKYTERADGGAGAPSAKENLWNALTKKDQQKDKGKGGGKSKSNAEISVVSLMMDGKTKSEEAKRKYLASITNPDRFATFSTYQKQQRAVEEEDDEEDEPDEEIFDDQEAENMEGAVEDGDGSSESGGGATSGNDFTQMKRQMAEDRASLNLVDKPESNAARDAVESILSMISSNNDKKAASAKADIAQTSKSTDNLAARLGQAAEEQEKRDAEARLAADRKKDEQRRKLAENQMQREEEARRKEVERMEKARRIAEEERRKKEDKEFTERAELQARQALQDEYWAKMLEKENARKGLSAPVEMKKKTGVLASDVEESLERKIHEDDRARQDEKEVSVYIYSMILQPSSTHAAEHIILSFM